MTPTLMQTPPGAFPFFVPLTGPSAILVEIFSMWPTAFLVVNVIVITTLGIFDDEEEL
jgi:hypothetical protein